MDVNVRSFEKNHGKIQAIFCNHASPSKFHTKVSETPHVQIVFYDSHFFETCCHNLNFGLTTNARGIKR
jgi:hypothetical protein